MLTGASGFVGHHMVEHFLKETVWDIIIVDKLSYSSNGFDRIRDINAYDDDRVSLFTSDLTKPFAEGLKQEIGDVDVIINLASGSHVDNSITDPTEFINNNVQLMQNVLEYCREIKPELLIQFSTDEVYGSAPEGTNYAEGDRFNPGNPYSASKAMQECLCYAYSNTYKVPIMVTNTMNVLRERQHPEKYLPLIINKVRTGETLSIHADPTCTKAGSRFYIHARNVADGVLHLLTHSDETLDNIDASKGKFHIVGEKELDNLELAKIVASNMDGELKYELVDFHGARPGHDLRYAMSGEKMKSIGWEPPVNIEDSIKGIVEWSLDEDNVRWLG